MRRTFLSSFDRAFKGLTPDEQVRILAAIEKLLVALRHRELLKGLGLKKLRGELWEARAGLPLRILFTFRSDETVFAFVGSHDDIRRFLKKS